MASSASSCDAVCGDVCPGIRDMNCEVWLGRRDRPPADPGGASPLLPGRDDDGGYGFAGSWAGADWTGCGFGRGGGCGCSASSASSSSGMGIEKQQQNMDLVFFLKEGRCCK